MSTEIITLRKVSGVNVYSGSHSSFRAGTVIMPNLW